MDEKKSHGELESAYLNPSEVAERLVKKRIPTNRSLVDRAAREDVDLRTVARMIAGECVAQIERVRGVFP